MPDRHKHARPLRTYICRLRVALVATCELLIMGFGSAAAHASAAAPATAFGFWNSMGVNTHLYYSNTPYADITEVAARLEQLGVMHIRDGLAPGRADEIAALNLLGSDGIKADLLLSQPGSDPTALLDVVKNQLAGDVDAIEGPNEYEYSGVGWQDRLVPFQETLDQDVHSILPGIPVVGASVGGVNLTGSLDVGNIHPYPGGHEPELGLDGQLAGAQTVSGTAPIWATETGYQDAMSMTPGSDQPATTDAAQAVYLPRLFAYYFSQGVQRTYIYELLNEFSDPTLSAPQSDFGLLNYDLTPKPQFYALENLIAAIRDQPNPEPTALNYAISNPGSSLDQLLLSRSDGSWQILIWRAEPVNADGQGATSEDVTLQLPFCSVVTSESPSDSSTVNPLGTNTQFDIDTGAALQVISVHRASTCGQSTVVLTPTGSQTPSNSTLPTSAKPYSNAPSATTATTTDTGSGPSASTRDGSAHTRKAVTATASDMKLSGLLTDRVAITLRVSQHDTSSPEIQRVELKLPSGLAFAKLGLGSALPATAGVVSAKGSTMVVSLAKPARSLRIYVRPGGIRESRSRQAAARRGKTAVEIRVSATDTTLNNAPLAFHATRRR